MARGGTSDVRQLLLQVDASVEVARRKMNDLATAVDRDSGRIDHSLARIDGATTRLGGAFGRLNSLAGTLGVSLGAAAFVQAGRSVLNFADELSAAADRAGVGVERYQTLREALRTLEVPAEAVDKVFERLLSTLGSVQNGADNGATQALDRLGIRSRILNGEIDTSDELLDAIAASSQRAGSQAQFASEMAEIFGRRLSGQLVPALNDGGNALHELETRARSAGMVLTQEMVTRLEEADETIERFTVRARVFFANFVADAIEDWGALGQKIGEVLGLLDEPGEASANRIAMLRRAAEAARTWRDQAPRGSAEWRQRDLNFRQRRQAALDELGRATEGWGDRPAAAAPADRPRVAARRDSGSRSGSEADFMWPVEGRRTGTFGEPRPGHTHAGYDLAVATGTRVSAAAAGTIIEAGRLPGYGNTIVIDHGGGTITRYAHLSQMIGREGQRVSAGELIALSGGARGAEGAGNSTGPHLHFEVRRDGRPVPFGRGRFPTGPVRSAAPFEPTTPLTPIPIEESLTFLQAGQTAGEMFDEWMRAPKEIAANFAAAQASLRDFAEQLGELPSVPERILSEEDQQRLDSFVDGFNRDLADGLAEAIMSGENLGDALVDAIRRASLELLSSGLMDLLSGRAPQNTLLSNLLGGGRVRPFGGGKGGAVDFFGGALKALSFGGGKAGGGDIVPGKWYMTGERGPEIIIPKVPGVVIPNGRGVGGGTTHQHFYIRGNLLTPEWWAQINRGHAMAAQHGAVAGAATIYRRAERRFP